MKSLTARPVEVIAVQWGPEWNRMLETAESLGRLGFMFDIKYSTPEQRRRGVEIFPELTLMDDRFRPHVVTQGLWIAIHPGYRQFRVLTTKQLDLEYEERQPE